MDPYALSRSGAKGLLQVMPATAREVSGRLGLAYSRSRLREDRGYNIALGSAYLAELLETFGGDRALALAAYNAGPNRVEEWLRIYGDPRSAEVDPIDWIELVPFAETRNYIQRVLESTAVVPLPPEGFCGLGSRPGRGADRRSRLKRSRLYQRSLTGTDARVRVRRR